VSVDYAGTGSLVEETGTEGLREVSDFENSGATAFEPPPR
jgi:hypothetical protein